MAPAINAYLAGGLVAIALLIGLVGGWLIQATTHGPGDAVRRDARRAGTGTGTGTGDIQRARAEQLVSALVDIADRVTNVVLADRARTAISSAGWTVVDPLGQPFDADHHRAVDRLVTGEVALHQTVAATERAGYLDPDGRVIRFPEVVVYQYEENR